jgi:hypothetical protein
MERRVDRSPHAIALQLDKPQLIRVRKSWRVKHLSHDNQLSRCALLNPTRPAKTRLVTRRTNMWRSFFAFVLLPAIAAAQAAQSQGVSPPPELNIKLSERRRTPQPVYRPLATYNAIRRGTTEEVAIQLTPGGYITTPASPVSGIVPLNLELQPTQGFTVSRLRYPKAHKQLAKFQSMPFPVADSLTFFKLHADRNASVGLHRIKGKLTFQPVDMITGPQSVRQVDVEISINVVEHNSRVARTGWPFHRIPTPVVVILIVLAIPVAVAALPFYLICISAGKCD